jgi:hypothetical protein
MEKNKTAALIYREKGHFGHIDHLAPFCSLHKIPLFLTSKTLYKITNEQYKDVDLYLCPPNEVSFQILKDYDYLVSTLPRQLINPIFLFDEMMMKKRIKSYFLPHGSSDKDNMGKLLQEDKIFVYGSRMLDLLPKKVHKKTIKTGNFRLKYYQLHKKFYDDLVKSFFPQIDKTENILYAPSWDNDDVQKWTTALIKHKPENITLYIKLHPNTCKEGIGMALPEAFGGYKDVVFINNYFPIYSLLPYMNSLFMDISSIGYDFLEFNKPILFTVKKDELLHKCGIHIDINNPYKDLNKDLHEKERLLLRDKTFQSNAILKEV